MFSTLPGIAHTTVNPGYFADDYLRLLDFAAVLGRFPVLTGDSKNAPPSNEDIARVAAAALMDPNRHGSRSYRPTGPTLLSAYDMVPVISEVLGRRVTAMPMPWALFCRAAKVQGVTADDLGNFKHYLVDHHQERSPTMRLTTSWPRSPARPPNRSRPPPPDTPHAPSPVARRPTAAASSPTSCASPSRARTTSLATPANTATRCRPSRCTRWTTIAGLPRMERTRHQ